MKTLRNALKSQFKWMNEIQDIEESFSFNVQPIREFIRKVAQKTNFVSTVFRTGVHTIDGRRGISHVTDGDDLRIRFLD